jgi:PIN domain nuclease of toxin-antitoxin system
VALLDTHIWAWMLTVDPILSPKARAAIDDAPSLFLSPASLYEISQKVRLGKWPLMERFASGLPDFAAEGGLTVAPLTAEVAILAGSLDWPHRDPFDRLLAATALVNGWPLISADPVFDSLTRLRRVW